MIDNKFEKIKKLVLEIDDESKIEILKLISEVEKRLIMNYVL